MENASLPYPRRAGPAWPPTRGELLRDVALFQAKLAIDGLRDLVLSPLSLVAAIVDLLLGDERRGQSFYGVLRAGRSSEDWIDLFAAARRWEAAPGPHRATTESRPPDEGERPHPR